MPPKKRTGFGKPIAPVTPPNPPPCNPLGAASQGESDVDGGFELQLVRRYGTTSTPIEGGGVCCRYWFDSPSMVDELRGWTTPTSPSGQSDVVEGANATALSGTNTPSNPHQLSPVTVVRKYFDPNRLRALAADTHTGKCHPQRPVSSRTATSTSSTHSGDEGEEIAMMGDPSESNASLARSERSSPLHATGANNATTHDHYTRCLYRDTLPLALCSGHPHIIDMIGLWHDAPTPTDTRKSFLLLEDLFYERNANLPISSSSALAKDSSASSFVGPTNTPLPHAIPLSQVPPSQRDRVIFRSTLQHFLDDIGVLPSPVPSGDTIAALDGEREERCKLRRRILLAQSVAYSILHGLAALEITSVRHRDIKPDNVCLRRQDPDDPRSPIVAKLIDFGGAHIKHSGPMSGEFSSLVGVGDTLGKVELSKGMTHEQADLQALGILIDWILVGGSTKDFTDLCLEESREGVRTRARGLTDLLRNDDGDIGQPSFPYEDIESLELPSTPADAELDSILRASGVSWLRRYMSIIALRDTLTGYAESASNQRDYLGFFQKIRCVIQDEEQRNVANVAETGMGDWYYEYYRRDRKPKTDKNEQKLPMLRLRAAHLLQHPLFDEFGSHTAPTTSLVQLIQRWELVGFDLGRDIDVGTVFDNQRDAARRASDVDEQDRIACADVFSSALLYGTHLQWSSTCDQLNRGPCSNSGPTNGYVVAPSLATTQLLQPLVKFFTDHPSRLLSLLHQESKTRILQQMDRKAALR